MRAIVKKAPSPGVELVTDAVEPEANDDEVVVRVAATSVCGADHHLYLWDEMGRGLGAPLPLILGHETAGTVVSVGRGVTAVRVGDRVAAESHLACGKCFVCRTGAPHLCQDLRILGITWDGAFAEFVKIPETACFSLPNSVALDVAALFEPAGVAVHALQRADSIAGESVLVCGCGPIGLYLVQLVMLAGATSVVAIDVNPYRRKLAESFGATAIDPNETDVPSFCHKLTRRHDGIGVGFEASGTGRMLEPVLESMKRGGVVVTPGMPPGSISIELSDQVNRKYLTLRGTYGRRIWETWEMLLALVESGRFDPSKIVTHRLSLEEFDRSMELLNGDAGKVLFHPA